MNFPRLLFVLVVLLPLLFSCCTEKLEPIAPTWDVDITVPLASRLHTMLSVVEKQPSLTTQGPGGTQIIYHSSMAAAPDSVKDRITLTVDPSVRSVKVGVFGLSAESLAVPFQLPGFTPGDTLPFIPPTTIAVPDVQDTISNFLVATFESGTITMSFRNNMPDTVIIVNDVVLSDSVQQLATFSFAGTRLWQNQTATRTASLAGKTVRRIVTVSNIAFQLVGRPGPVPLPSGPMLNASVSMTSLRARSAYVAFIPPQRLTNNDTTFLGLSDSTLAKEVLFKKGTLRLNFVSRVQVALKMIYKFPEVLRPIGPGVPYVDSLSLAAHDSGVSLIALPGIRIKSLDGDLIRSLQAISSLDLPGSVSPVTLNDTDKVSVTLTSIGDLTADSAAAVIKPTWIDVNRAVALNLADFSSKLSAQFVIPSGGLHLDAFSTIGFPMDLNLQISARNPSTGVTMVLNIPPSQRRIFPGKSTVVFDSVAVGTFLTGLSPKLPDSVKVTGNVLVNPPDVYNPTLAGVGTILSSSYIQDTVVVDVPLRLSLTNGIYRDTVALTELSDRKEQLDQTNSGTVVLEIQNALPLQAGIQVYFLDSTGTRVLLRVPQSGVPIAVPPATVDAGGNVTAPVPSTTTIVLSTADIRAMTPSKKLACAISLATAPGGPVRVRTSDYIALRLWSKLSYRVSK
jgi:hypothetical protein